MLTRLFSFAVFLTFAGGIASAAAASAPIGVGSLAGVRDFGRAPATVGVRIAVVMNYHRDAELESLTQAQADPGSPVFHHFLTPAQFASYFSPTAAEYAAVLSSLQRGGFTITHTFPNRTVIDAAAAAPVAAKYFGTVIDQVVAPDGRRTYTNVRPGVVPANIANSILTVQGLDAVGRMRPTYAFGPNSRHRILAPAVSPDTKPIFGPDGGYGPQVFIKSYNLPAKNGITGTGRASGVATDADFLDSDLKAFLTYFRIHRTGPPTKRVLVDGGPPPGNGPDSVETALDVEQIVSIAPGTALYVYEVTYDEPTNGNFIDIYNQVVTDNKIDTLNTSYGYCETALPNGYPAALNAVAKQGNALGITFHAASGDGGSNWAGCTGVSVGTPVDIPHNVGVGGTTLGVDANGNETSEVGWGGSGGGVSVLFGLPKYQHHVPNIITSGRNIPDVAFDADPGSGASYYYGGGWSGPIGGTSMASPIFGASLTEMNQVLGSRAGHFNVTLYKTWLANGYGNGQNLYIRDITQGCIPPYCAKTGYDQMTGIGALQINNFDKLLHI